MSRRGTANAGTLTPTLIGSTGVLQMEMRYAPTALLMEQPSVVNCLYDLWRSARAVTRGYTSQ